MNRQLIFDETVKHARHQGCKATRIIDGEEGCAYRGANNITRCFIGAHITDDTYNPRMEGLTTGALLKAFPLIRNYFGITSQEGEVIIRHNNMHLLSRLQQIHDGYAVVDWEEQFKRTAEEFGLIYTPPLPKETESAQADDVELAPVV